MYFYINNEYILILLFGRKKGTTKEKQISEVSNVTDLRNDTFGRIKDVKDRYNLKTSNGTVDKNYTYNSFNQLTKETSEIGGNAISNKTYSYDANGNQTSVKDSFSNENISIEYNEMDMMTKYVKNIGNTEIANQGVETSFNLIAPDGRIGTVRCMEDNIYLYNKDNLGSTTKLKDLNNFS